MVFTVLKGSGLQFEDLKGWETSPVVDSESLQAFRHLRKRGGSVRVSKLTWKFSPNLIDCGSYCISLKYLFEYIILK